MTQRATKAQARRGLLYCATYDPIYVAEAFLSAASAKRHMPDLPIAIATDIGDHPLVRHGPFDIVIPLAPGQDFGSGWVTGKFQRLMALRRSPFRQTLHLDCDTRVLGPRVGKVFDRMTQGPEFMATECLPETSFCRRAYGARMFNGGVLAFRDTARVGHFLALWQRLTGFQHRHIRAGTVPGYVAHVSPDKWRRKLLRMDQVSLAQIVSPETNRLGLNVEILPRRWNDRLTPREALDGSGVLISHLASYHHTVLPDLLDLALSRASTGQRESATLLYDAVRTIVVKQARLGEPAPRAGVPGSLAWQWRILTETPAPTFPDALRRAILHNLFGQGQVASDLAAATGQTLAPAPEGTLAVNFVRPVRPRRRKEIA